jgi:trypsin-like peptidase
VDDLNAVVFPIIRQDFDSGEFRLIGTGFFITDNGLFVSAKHVLLDVVDGRGTQTAAIGLVQFLPGDSYMLRPILRCVSHETADVTVGIVAPLTHNATGAPFKNKILTLTEERPAIGAQVATYAYPRTVSQGTRPQQLHFHADYFSGRIEEYFAHGRDRALLPAPCFQTSMYIHGGASGGPVFGNSGRVFGVNSTGFDDTDCSFVSRITDILTLKVPGVVTPRHPTGDGVLVQELADDGFVVLHR